MADGTGRLRTCAEVLVVGPWRELPGCPGRLVWRGDRSMTPEDLAGPDAVVEVFTVDAARDPVHVAALPDGGLISYRQPDGTWVHTLNSVEGFERKLAQLGVRDQGPGTRD